MYTCQKLSQFGRFSGWIFCGLTQVYPLIKNDNDALSVIRPNTFYCRLGNCIVRRVFLSWYGSSTPSFRWVTVCYSAMCVIVGRTQINRIPSLSEYLSAGEYRVWKPPSVTSIFRDIDWLRQFRQYQYRSVSLDSVKILHQQHTSAHTSLTQIWHTLTHLSERST